MHLDFFHSALGYGDPNRFDWLVLFSYFLFYIRVWMIKNIMIVSGRHQSDSAIQIHECILPQSPLQSGLPHNIEQSFLCYTVGPCWLSILSIAVCTRFKYNNVPKLRIYPLPSFFPPGNHRFVL